MKKRIIPVSVGSLPPLIMTAPTQKKTPATKNPIQPKVLKAIKPASSPTKLSTQPLLVQMNPSNSSNISNMRLVQTSTGKKLLLTNVVNVSKPSSNRQVLLVPKANAQPTDSSASSVTQIHQINPVVAANAPRTVIIQTSTSDTSTGEQSPAASQPLMLKVAGMNQPLMVKCSSHDSAVSIKEEPGTKPSHVITVLSTSTASPTTTTSVTEPITSTAVPIISPADEPTTPQAAWPVTSLASKFITPLPPTLATALPGKPITSLASASNPIMILNGGTTTFKVVGKPVPVKLNSRLQKIAPKAQFITGSFSPQISLPPLKKLGTPKKAQLATPVKNGVSTKPPAYLNIQIKEEPQETLVSESITVDGVHIKEEKEDLQPELEESVQKPSETDPMLDIRVKEEPTDEQNELLAKDEQLRQVLGVTNRMTVAPHPRFYIRTSEGKLVSISHEEAEALGLDHNDKVENNQKKLLNAITSVKSMAFVKSFGQEEANSKTRPPEATILIPEDVNVKDYVSCNVPPEAEKAAALMKNLGSKSVGTNKLNITPKSNTSIIGEVTEAERRFLRIQIENESQERDLCDIPITPLNTFRCPFCTRDFKNKDHIISHIRVHTGERPYPCDVCGKRYRQRIDIIRHMRIHTGEKPFTCGMCNASFNQKSNLRSHMRIHTGERPVQCRVCGKGFSRNTHLKQHMKLHTGEKPFQCSVCLRPFRFKSGLQAHERIHTGLKPYACSLCGRTFTQIVGLIRHERTHSGEKPFRCQSCGKSFDNRENLKAHVLKHTSERPFTCDLCEKTFTDQPSMRCHRKKYHSNLLLCVICLREDFKDRIELREHLRAHERENWHETPEGELVPIVRDSKSGCVVSVDDTMENLVENDEIFTTERILPGVDGAEEIQVEVELDPDDPMETDDDGEDSEYEEHELQIEEETDPLA